MVAGTVFHFDAQTFNEGYLKNPHREWGAGPYKVDKFDYNSSTVSFVPNEKWWGEKPKLDRVTFRQMESQATINAFQAGEIDATDVATKDTLAIAKSMKDVDIRGALRPKQYFGMFNSKAPGLEDVKVREALFTGIDRSTLAQIQFNGLDYTEQLPGSIVLYQTQPGYEDNFSPVVQYDQEKAKQLLDDAGWAVGSDGIREKEGKKLALRYVSFGDSQLVKSTAAAMQKMLKDLGVDLSIVEKPSSEFSRVFADRDFDVVTMEFDAKIAELEQIPDREEQTRKANELEREAFGQYGIMPYANGPQLVASKKTLANFGATSFAFPAKENIGWAK